MKIVSRLFLACVMALSVQGFASAQQVSAEKLENILYLDVKGGRVAIQLRPDLAPAHVERVKKLTREGFFDGLKFHRVIDGFMAQSGDPRGDGTGGSKYPDLRAEFSGEPFVRGVVGAARGPDQNSANSQFFITYAPASHLNGKYTVWGQVIRGMRHVDAVKKGRLPTGAVSNPDTIAKAVIAAEAKDHSVLNEQPDPAPEEARGSYQQPRGSY